MILVTLGTRAFQFDRLLKELDSLCRQGIINEALVVQSVSSGYSPEFFKIEEYFSAEQIRQYMIDSRLIITHGGTGSIIDALKLGKTIIGIPRLSKYNEVIDDHQVEIIRFFRNQHFIIGIEDVSQLEEALEKSKHFEPIKFVSGNEKIKSIIKDFLKKM